MKTVIDYVGLGHICIIVDDIEEAALFYSSVLGANRIQEFPNFKNIGFSKSAGFLENPERVDVTIRFLSIPNTNVVIELMQYHSPEGSKEIKYHNANDIGGVRHIALKVNNIDEAFDHIKNQAGATLINTSDKYRPFKIDSITEDQFRFFDESLEQNKAEKENVCKIVENIKYFYFIDKYGVQWELEQGHSDIGE